MSTQMSPGVQTIEDIRTAPVDVPLEPGGHERLPHYVQTDESTEVRGAPVVALYGKVWVPNRQPEKYPAHRDRKDALEQLIDDDGE